MGVGVLLLIILAFIVTIFLGITLTGYLTNESRKSAEDYKTQAFESRQREKIATRALRAIANGAGAPVLEAQDALDQIEGTYTKELN